MNIFNDSLLSKILRKTSLLPVWCVLGMTCLGGMYTGELFSKDASVMVDMPGMANPGIKSPSIGASKDFSASPVGKPSIPSVHDMFKDVPQDELMMMMEEGQQFIKYLEEHGTPEEKLAFAQAMEETLKSFTPEDWDEFEAIVKVVEEKMPAVIQEPKAKTAEVISTQKAPEEKKVPVVIDNSIEKLLISINKTINAILIKAKSDKVLSERIALSWNKKDQFHELTRLIQLLNSKELIEKLSSSKEESVKMLVELLQNFNKRLQIENNEFIIADTFGLEVDEKTSIANLKKLNKIIELFNDAIEALTPKLVSFLQTFEPEALKKAKEHDDEAKKALDHATKVEKQKRPATMPSYGYNSSGGSVKRPSQSHANKEYGYYDQGYRGSQTPQNIDYLDSVHQKNLNKTKDQKKTLQDQAQAKAKEKSDKDKESIKKSDYQKAVDALDNYFDIHDAADVNDYMKTIGNMPSMYSAFGAPIDTADKEKVEKIFEKKSTDQSLEAADQTFLEKHHTKHQDAYKNFSKNIQKAHAHYNNQREAIERVARQVDEMSQVLTAIKNNLDNMSSADLEKLQQSAAFKSFASRISSYHDKFKQVQHDLKNKHKLHKLAQENPYETSAYNELARAESLHGLDSKIANVKYQFESLQKLIKASISKRRRQENKLAAI